jgi:hypothetical protein
VGRDAPLEQFLQELAIRSKEPPLDGKSVTLMTIHGAKGREFDHVYVAGLAEDVLPSYQSVKAGRPVRKWRKSGEIASWLLHGHVSGSACRTPIGIVGGQSSHLDFWVRWAFNFPPLRQRRASNLDVDFYGWGRSVELNPGKSAR